jgi:hypothetical protein
MRNLKFFLAIILFLAVSTSAMSGLYFSTIGLQIIYNSENAPQGSPYRLAYNDGTKKGVVGYSDANLNVTVNLVTFVLEGKMDPSTFKEVPNKISFNFYSHDKKKKYFVQVSNNTDVLILERNVPGVIIAYKLKVSKITDLRKR